MQRFIQDPADSTLAEGETAYQLSGDPVHYAEYTQNLGWAVIVTNCIVLDRTSMVVAMCWDHDFDPLPTLLALHGKAAVQDIADSYPTLAEMVGNAMDGQYERGALVQLNDFDDGSAKWFVVVSAMEVRITSPEFIFEGEALEAATTALEKSLSMLTELLGNDPRFGDTMWRGFKRGARIGLTAAIKSAVKDAISDFSEITAAMPEAQAASTLRHRSFEEFYGFVMAERGRRGTH